MPHDRWFPVFYLFYIVGWCQQTTGSAFRILDHSTGGILEKSIFQPSYPRLIPSTGSFQNNPPKLPSPSRPSQTSLSSSPIHHSHYINHRIPSLSPNSKNTSQRNTANKSLLRMDLRMLGLDSPLFSALAQLADSSDEHPDKSFATPTRTYVRDARAMASTPADVKELPSSYVFTIDMPGLKTEDMKVQIEEGNVLVISGERKRPEEEKEGVKYLRMERRMGKFMRKFALPENANLEAISAVCQDGVLTVTVEKLPPPEPKKPKMIEVRVA